ncbi:hypothetical protein BLNAU_17722 [Blattamonas nauphoetae]|uniref:Uncharacterized protein n=1 Tax=Blattamonas nauphoetae TaxID=2049346 RepID=A0ABQ9XAT9_9EUKA|nr:hypothetical protein BLNAU_17722 [Blattamonas nauphoetae]
MNNEKLLLNNPLSVVPPNHSWEHHADTGQETTTGIEDTRFCEYFERLFVLGGRDVDWNGEENRLNDLWQFSIERNGPI